MGEEGAAGALFFWRDRGPDAQYDSKITKLTLYVTLRQKLSRHVKAVARIASGLIPKCEELTWHSLCSNSPASSLTKFFRGKIQ